MRRLGKVSTVAHIGTTVRHTQSAIGRVELRLTKYYDDTNSEQAEAKYKAYLANLAAQANPAPKNKKEALAHLTQSRLSYEGVSDFQRAADDMMAMRSEPMELATDMAYHYHRVFKGLSFAKTHQNDTTDAWEYGSQHPNT